MNQRRLAAVAAALAVWGCLSGLVLIRLWAVLYGRLSGPVILVLAAALAGVLCAGLGGWAFYGVGCSPSAGAGKPPCWRRWAFCWGPGWTPATTCSMWESSP